MTNPSFASVDDFREIESLNRYAEAVAAGQGPQAVLAALRIKSRANARTPMQSAASPHAGFTTGTPWLPANANHTEINAEAALADPDSVFHPLPSSDRAAPSAGGRRAQRPHAARGEHPHVYAYVRRHDGVELLVVAKPWGERPCRTRGARVSRCCRITPTTQARCARGKRACT
jgi:oligo-1,6-glucosidase